jgi:hypothetical protein
VNWIEVEASPPRRVAQEFEVQAGRSELGRSRDGSTQAGIRSLKRRKKGKKGGKENGWHGHYGLPASSSSDPSQAPRLTTTGTCGSGGIRVLHADDGNQGCGFAGAGNTSGVRNLDVDKVGAADSLTGAVHGHGDRHR